jgi:hypothetical protein
MTDHNHPVPTDPSSPSRAPNRADTNGRTLFIAGTVMMAIGFIVGGIRVFGYGGECYAAVSPVLSSLLIFAGVIAMSFGARWRKF